MGKGFIHLASGIIRAVTFTGPIFGKELRVSSRRRRNYLLRFVYLALLTGFVALVWLAGAQRYLRPGASAYRISRMSEAGKLIVFTVIWFQFCVTQLIAMVMLSTSICEEIYDRTLGVLMTTPISSLQIVMGKLLSKLWQLLILVAVSLPVLAVVRVFGGVPWDFVAAGVCITFAGLLFVASVSMFFSVYSRRAYAAILKTLFAVGFLHGLVPLLIFVALEHSFPDRDIISVLSYANPYLSLIVVTELADNPWLAGRWGLFSWPWHCVTMLGMSAAVLALCVRLVRRAALRQIAGQTRAGPRVPPRALVQPAAAPAGAQADPPPPPMLEAVPAGRIRPVIGSPVLWRELRTPLLRRRLYTVLIVVAAVGGLLVTYAIAAAEHDLDDEEVQVLYIFCFVCLGVLVTAVISATGITAEKEARSWPLLVMTTLGAGQILLGKAAGAFRRCLPTWALMGGHVLLFTLVGYIHPMVCLHLAIIVTYAVAFLIGTGLYFSSLFRRTTTAVVANICLVAAVWGAVPAVAVIFMEESRPWRNSQALQLCVNANPGVQAIVAAIDTCGRRNAREDIAGVRYEWPYGRKSLADTTRVMLGSMFGYILAGVFFAWRAAARFRRDVFRS